MTFGGYDYETGNYGIGWRRDAALAPNPPQVERVIEAAPVAIAPPGTAAATVPSRTTTAPPDESKREAWRRETTTEGVHVCQGTWCRFDGARDVLKELRQAVRSRGLKERVRVRGVPCMALCQAGPVVKMLPDRTRYWDVQPAAIDRLVDAHFDPAIAPMSDIPNPDPPGVETGPLLRAPSGKLRQVPAIVQSIVARLARN